MAFKLKDQNLSLREKIINLNWGLVILLVILAAIGTIALYSAAGGNADRWATPHMIRFAMGIVICLFVALMDIRFWMSLSYLAYAGTLILLCAVELMGFVGMGAQRWINLGFIQLQPSEVMKITLIMALARYFHGATMEQIRSIFFLIPPLLMIFTPAALVMLQPDLGTAVVLVMAGAAVLWVAGVRWWKFVLAGVGAASLVPVAWYFFLHEYQKKRVLTFLNPENDPLGAGYHITQSKIALGSGGLQGKGFMQGTQSQLNFLPEKHTDFIFTLLAEEWGFFGGLFLFGILGAIFIYGYLTAFSANFHYGRLLALGLIVNFSLYVFINIGMVMGLMPVVGVPLPMVSYGGTAMLTVLVGFGLIMSVNIHKDTKIPRYY